MDKITQKHKFPEFEDILWVLYGLHTGVCCYGFGLNSVYQVSVSRTCAGSQMTLW